ncbi:MAG: phosphatidylglycerophosphatase A [Desulfovibrio sp.]|jgi:phosphatidylglycerophosphatase A|nr:phosphatidylglycerophosphatase A [Desulfovibrio sp.]
MSDALILGVARLGIAGKSKIMPGTCGSLVAVFLAPFIFIPLPLFGRVLALLVLLLAGVPVCTRAEALLGRKDPPEVVLDELFGQWLTLLPCADPSTADYCAAFILFRVFDMAKPRPIPRLEALGGGLGIMLDDAAAGVYAMLCLFLVKQIGLL